MNRRRFVQMAAGGALGSVAGERALRAQEKAARATRGMRPPKINEISLGAGYFGEHLGNTCT